MAYYYSNEDDRILSEKEIRSLWEVARSDGDPFLTETYERFLEGCMYWNNGDLTPLPEYINSLHRRLSRTDDPDAVTDLTAEIAYCMELMKGESDMKVTVTRSHDTYLVSSPVRDISLTAEEVDAIRSEDNDATLESVFTGKSGYRISIWRFGRNDYSAAWGDTYSVRGTFAQVMEELKGEI